MNILDCGHEPTKTEGCGTGVGYDEHGTSFCYECSTIRERELMQSTGRAVLYLVIESCTTRVPEPHHWTGVIYGNHKVTNWTGLLSFPVRNLRRGRHNIARVRYDFDFTFDGYVWHGTQYGDNTTIAQCRRTRLKL